MNDSLLGGFGPRSRAQLATCDLRLQVLFTEVNAQRPCTILEGWRSRADQERDFEKGASRVHWPHGKHNIETAPNAPDPATPCKAADVKPDDLAWTSPAEDWREFADLVQGIAAQQGVTIRWGGAWDGAYPNPPGIINDLDHFEIHDA